MEQWQKMSISLDDNKYDEGNGLFNIPAEAFCPDIMLNSKKTLLRVQNVLEERATAL